MRHLVSRLALMGLAGSLLLCSACYRPPSMGPVASPTLAELEPVLDATLDLVRQRRQLNADQHAAWQVLHGVLAYGHDFPLRVKDRDVSAVQYLEDGGYVSGWNFEAGMPLENGRVGLRALVEPGSYQGQGHADQWLAILAQCGLAPEQPIVVRGRTYQMRDLIEQVKLDVPANANEEWSWTLVGLSHYLPTTDRWTASDGSDWDFESLLSAEMRQDLAGSACGGTHRLIGISMALERRKKEGAKMSPLWRDADAMMQQAATVARQYQNADGSFSTNYFARPGVTADNAQVLATTGHTLEFLALTLDAQALREPWVVRSVQRLCEVLQSCQDLPLECGGLYHAVHGLVIYRNKVFRSTAEDSVQHVSTG